MKVKYTGRADAYELGAEDFKKAGVEGKKTRFPRDVAVEVPDEVGEALISDEGLFHDFPFEEADEDDEEAAPKSSKRKSSDDSEMTDSGHPQTSDGTEGTGTARSTRGRGRSAGAGTGTGATTNA